MPLPFDPATTAFSANNALALATASQIAYEKNQTSAAKKAASQLGCSDFHPFDTKDTQGFVAANKDIIIVAFRGTQPDNLKDWLTDIEIAPIDFQYIFEGAPDIGHIHNGFGHAIYDVWAEVAAAATAFQNPGAPKSLWTFVRDRISEPGARRHRNHSLSRADDPRAAR